MKGRSVCAASYALPASSTRWSICFIRLTDVLTSELFWIATRAFSISVKVPEFVCISDNNQADMFVTVWIAILEISTGKLTCSNSGHEYPVIKRAGGKFELLKDPHEVTVDWIEDHQYTEYTQWLHPGDRVFLYTDGVTEATDVQEEMFGSARMVEALNADCDAQPRQLLSNVREFVKDAEQFNDLTMLCLDYKGAEEAVMSAPDPEES